MTTVFQKNRLKLLTNGVPDEQYTSRIKEESGLVKNEPGLEDPATTTTINTSTGVPPDIPDSVSSTSPALDGSVDHNVIVKTETRSQANENAADESDPEVDILINNVVCSFSVGCHLNLRQIALNGYNVEYRRESGMVTMKLRKPHITASVWSSGKITCTGATSEDEAKAGARRIARVIQKLGFNAKVRKMRIVNVLGSCIMPWEIKITMFSQRFREADYEPELHPGVTYKVKHLKATLKIFSTGSITVTAPSVPNVQQAIEYIYPLVHEFRKEFISEEEKMRKRPHNRQRLSQEKAKRKRLDDDEDKGVQSITS